MKTLTDRVALITGAAGGIGQVLAADLARQGMRLILVDVDEARAQAVADSLPDPGRCAVHAVDVRDAQALDALAATITASHGELSVLIPAAGATVWGTFDTHNADDIDWILDLNVRGVAHTCRAFLPLLTATAARHGEGQVVVFSSMQGMVGVPMQSLYVTSKYALRGLADTLRIELSAKHIGVTTVLPGAVRGRFMANGRSHDEDAIGEMLPYIDRFGSTPEAVSRAVVKGIQKNRAEVVVGADAHITSWLRWLLPPLVPGLFGLSFRKLTPDGRITPKDG